MRIGSHRANPKTRTFAEPPIDCEEDRMLRAVLVGMLMDAEAASRSPYKRMGTAGIDVAAPSARRAAPTPERTTTEIP